ncbi:hypothetical protein E0K89_007710 [Aquicoccus sp. SCR17]|nr:hypothetical protein [Carideicomes alvinocaridis]
MKTVKKLSRGEFDSRIRRIESDAAPRRRPVAEGRPGLAACATFAWLFLVAGLASGEAGVTHDRLDALLLPALRGLLEPALALALAATVAVLLVHLVRFLLGRRGRGTSGGVLLGAVAAIGLIMLPPEVKAPGYALLQTQSRAAYELVQRSVHRLEENGFGEGLLPGD